MTERVISKAASGGSVGRGQRLETDGRAVTTQIRPNANGHVPQGLITDSGIGAGGGVLAQRKRAHCRVRAHFVVASPGERAAGGIEDERVITHGRVAVGRIVHQGLVTDGRVAAGVDVVIESKNTDGGVANASGVALERPKTGGRVPYASSVAKERVKTGRRVAVGCVVLERPITDSRAAVAAGVVYQGERSNGCVVSTGGVE